MQKLVQDNQNCNIQKSLIQIDIENITKYCFRHEEDPARSTQKHDFIQRNTVDMINCLIHNNSHQPCHGKDEQVDTKDRYVRHVFFRVKCNPSGRFHGCHMNDTIFQCDIESFRSCNVFCQVFSSIFLQFKRAEGNGNAVGCQVVNVLQFQLQRVSDNRQCINADIFITFVDVIPCLMPGIVICFEDFLAAVGVIVCKYNISFPDADHIYFKLEMWCIENKEQS